MPVNDIYTLPPKVRTMAEMADLLQAEQSELDLLLNTITVIFSELNISSSEHLIPRYEDIFSLSQSHTLTPSERRAKIIAKLNTRGSTTVKALRELVKTITGCDSEIVEYFSDYRFSVIVHLLYPDATKDLQELILQIEEVKPAHLAFDTVAAIEPLDFKNQNELTVEQLNILLRHNNFGVESIYLNGIKNLDGSWKLSQSYNKGIAFHQLKIPVRCQTVLCNSYSCLFQSKVCIPHATQHSKTAVTLRIPHTERFFKKTFGANVKHTNPQTVRWTLIEDTVYYLDGNTGLNGSKKLNAAIKRSEL